MQSEFSEDSINTYDSDEDGRQVDTNESKEVKVVIFDWDDTLFSTCYLEIFQLDYKSIFSEQKAIDEVGTFLLNEIQSLEESIINLFEDLIQETEVRLFIVTNADQKWIENCLKHFMPELKNFLEENSIKFYSAKKLYGKQLSLEKWKTRCFKKLILDNFTERNISLKVLSIGDSSEEKVAALGLKAINYYRSLEVKFLETYRKPDINILKMQFQYIIENLNEIFSSKQFYHKIQFGVNAKTNRATNKDSEDK